MERRAAIAANFLLGALDAQPVPARGTSGTQTLHRRTRQILHRPPRFVSGPSAAANPKCPVATREFRKGYRDCERGGLVCQGKLLLLVVVQFRNGKSSFWDGRSLQRPRPSERRARSSHRASSCTPSIHGKIAARHRRLLLRFGCAAIAPKRYISPKWPGIRRGP